MDWRGGGAAFNPKSRDMSDMSDHVKAFLFCFLKHDTNITRHIHVLKPFL